MRRLLLLLLLVCAFAQETGEGEECQEHHGGADVILVLFFMLLLGLVVRYALQWVPVPYTALLLMVGLVLGAMQIRLTSRPPEISESLTAEPHTEEASAEEEGTTRTEEEPTTTVEETTTDEAETPVADEETPEGGSEPAETEETAETTAFIESNGHSHRGNAVINSTGHDHWEKFAIGIDAWQSIEPELLLLVFLPALIFSSAYSLDFHITKKSFGQVLILAGPGVIIGTALTAVFVKYVFPYEWCWPKAFMFGAMISATDPVAVVALLKEVGASKRLGTVIEGESLLNDGTAFVFFLLFRDMIPTTADCLNDPQNCKNGHECPDGRFEPTGCLTERGVGESISFFLQLALGGPALGIGFGLAATLWIQYIYNDLLTEISVTLATAYLTFYVAEDVCEVSGVLSVVALGLFMGSFAKDRISSNVHEAMHVFWEMMEYVANTLIFVYTGLKIALELFDHTNPSSKFIGNDEWGYAIVLYIILQLIRFVTIFMLLPILGRMGYGFTWKEGLVATWGGLRGAVGLALALIVELDEQHIPPSFRSYTIFFLGFTVMATLLINGTTMPYLLKLLGITKTSPEKLEVLFHLLSDMEDCDKNILHSHEDDLLGMPDYDRIKKLTALDITQIIPTAKELEHVIESAAEHNHPSSLTLHNNITRRSMAALDNFNPHMLGDIVEEDVDAEHRVDIDKRRRKSMFDNFQEFFFPRNRSSSIPDSPRKEGFTPDMLMQDLRSRLLQGVKTAYAEQLEKGFINAKAMFDLIESADKAIDRLHRPICDWRYLEKDARPSQWRVEFQKLHQFSCKGCMGDMPSKMISKVLFDAMLYSVLVTRTYIEAHEEAEHALHGYIKSEMDEEVKILEPRKYQMMEEAVAGVIRESKESTKAAFAVLRDLKQAYPEVLRAIKTRLTAQEILLKKQSYLHQIEAAGLIENREATAIRDMIDAKIKYLTYNALVLDLPDLHDLLQFHPLFNNLSNQLFDSQVWPHAKPKVFSKGSQIYTIGGEPKHVTIIVRGLVKMVDSTGEEAPIGDGFGSALGVSEIMLNRPRAISMVCETTCEVIQIDRVVFEALVERFMSIRIRSWQLTGMMLTYLNPWSDFVGCTIVELASVFKNAQLLEFEENQELRVRTRSYLIIGSVQEAGFVQDHRVVVGPSPMGPGMGIYNCLTAVKVLRLPTGPTHHGKGNVGSFDSTKRMLARSSTSMSRMSLNVPHGGISFAGKSLVDIPEGRISEEGAELDVDRSLERRGSMDYAMSADLETRAALARRMRRSSSIEF